MGWALKYEKDEILKKFVLIYDIKRDWTKLNQHEDDDI